jgi:hypothetical protein
MARHYNINASRFPEIIHNGEPRGVAFVVEPSVAIDSDTTKHSGSVRIFDQVGNAVSDEFEMQFMELERGIMAGVAVWDVHNQSGRVVAPKAYVAIINIRLVLEDGSLLEMKDIRRTVNISQNER